MGKLTRNLPLLVIDGSLFLTDCLGYCRNLGAKDWMIGSLEMSKRSLQEQISFGG